MEEIAVLKTNINNIQTANCVIPASVVPKIFPRRSLIGFTEEINTSIILLVFSSITLRIIILP